MPRALLAAVVLGAAAGCGRGDPAAAPRAFSDWFTVRVGGQPVRMQVALSDAEMARGLMGRRDLAPDQGMLFVYAAPQVMKFWMENTPLPLDIGYFGPTGELEEVHALYPFDATTVRSRGDRLQFALEMNQGWFRAHGIRPGALLDLADLRAALAARGAAPGDYGLEPPR